MSKIFLFSGQKGSLIDQVGHTAGTFTSGSSRGFVNTEKGTMLEFDDSATDLNFGNLFNVGAANEDFSYCWSGKMGPVGVRVFGKYQGATHRNFGLISTTELQIYHIYDSTSVIDTRCNYTFVPGQNYHIVYIADRDVGGYIYINGILQTNTVDTMGTSTIVNTGGWRVGGYDGSTIFRESKSGKFEIYDHALTADERTKCYEEFLHSYNIAPPKRGFITNKPTDLSNENGLVFATNMIPQNGELVDISGNSNTGTITGALSTLEGMSGDGIDDTVNCGNGSSIQLGTGDYSFAIRLRRITTPGTTKWILAKGGGGGVGTASSLQTTGKVKFEIEDAGGNTNVAASNVLSSSEFETYVGTFDRNGNLVVYCNGIQDVTVDISSRSGTVSNAVNLTLFSYSTPSDYSNVEIADFRIYNRALTPQQAKDYHNSFIKTSLIEDFGDLNASGVNTVPREWDISAGTVKGGELVAQDSVLKDLDTGTKYIEATATPATLATQSTQAYGEWEFDAYKGADGNTNRVNIISSDNAGGTNTGYAAILTSVEEVRLNRTGSGVLFSTDTSYIDNNTWYRLKITRTTDGEFTVLIKGGAFTPTTGYDGWTLVQPTGESLSGDPVVYPSNPTTDNTYTTSQYCVLDLDVLDKCTNLLFKNQKRIL